MEQLVNPYAQKNIPQLISYWVEASLFPSGLKAAAMVDLGGGKSLQYLAERYLSDSDSTLKKNTVNHVKLPKSSYS